MTHLSHLRQTIAPFTFAPAIAAIDTAAASGSLAACVAAIDAALRDPKIQPATPLCESLREWRAAVSRKAAA